MPVERHGATNGRTPCQLGDTSRVQLISLAVPVLAAPALARFPKRLSPERVRSQFLSLRHHASAQYSPLPREGLISPRTRSGRPSSKGGGNPPAAIGCGLRKLTRTNPQVALGSSRNRLITSSAVNSSGMVDTFNSFCDRRHRTAALTSAARFRTSRRSTDETTSFDTDRPLTLRLHLWQC